MKLPENRGINNCFLPINYQLLTLKKYKHNQQIHTNASSLKVFNYKFNSNLVFTKLSIITTFDILIKLLAIIFAIFGLKRESILSYSQTNYVVHERIVVLYL